MSGNPIGHRRQRTPHRRRVGSTLTVFLVVGAALLAGCSGDGGGGDEASASSDTTDRSDATSTVSTAPGEAPTPQPSPTAAVEALLAAEQANDAAASYRVLAPSLRETYRTVAEWSERRSERPPVTGYTIGEVAGDGEERTVEAVVEHPPDIDAFVGLSTTERHTYTLTSADGGWLVAAEPEVRYVTPPDAAAAEVVAGWAEAVRTCDEAAAAEFEGLEDLFGVSAAASELCGSQGAVEVGEVGSLESGPGTQDLIAQYSTDALFWGRVVPVTAPTEPFRVIVAPIGDAWKVVGFFD